MANINYKTIFSNSHNTSGVYKGLAIYDGSETRVYVPGMNSTNLSEEELISKKQLLYRAIWTSKEMLDMIDTNVPTPVQCVFEIGKNNYVAITGVFGRGLKEAGELIYKCGIHYNENGTYEILEPGDYLGGSSSGGPSGSGGTGGSGGSLLTTGPINVEIIDGNITLEQLAQYDKKSYLEFVCPIYKQYCAQFGIKYPGVLALQPFYEVSGQFPKKTSNVARADNNLGGLKYHSDIPNATSGSSVPANEKSSGPSTYAHFNSVSEYYYAHVWQIGHGTTYSNALKHQDSVESFARCLLATWVKGYPSHDPSSSISYSEDLLADYRAYGLSRYEN